MTLRERAKIEGLLKNSYLSHSFAQCFLEAHMNMIKADDYVPKDPVLTTLFLNICAELWRFILKGWPTFVCPLIGHLMTGKWQPSGA